MNFVIFAVYYFITHYVAAESSTSSVQEDVDLDFCELAIKYAKNCEGFDVVTEDKYILKLFHVKGDKTRPVLVSHGNADSSDAFVIRGNTSLVVDLANEGYDAWYINFRGNTYSRRHETLNPDKDIKFWDYSYEDIGIKDLSANIDFVLDKTGQTQLSLITHSQGFSTVLALTSIKKEYNNKIKSCIAMAPFALGIHMTGPMSLGPPLWPIVGTYLDLSNQYELNKANSTSTIAHRKACSAGLIGYEICCKNGLCKEFSTDANEIEPEFYPVVLTHFPSSISKKNYEHVIQNVNSKKFARFDYGKMKNLQLYGSSIAPEFPLEEITIKIFFLVGANDNVATVKDAKILQSRLSNTSYHEFEGKGHLDFDYGRSMKEFLFPLVNRLLKSYN